MTRRAAPGGEGAGCRKGGRGRGRGAAQPSIDAGWSGGVGAVVGSRVSGLKDQLAITPVSVQGVACRVRAVGAAGHKTSQVFSAPASGVVPGNAGALQVPGPCAGDCEGP